jgi:hypothetical protein
VHPDDRFVVVSSRKPQRGEAKSGLHRAVRRVTPGQGDLKESGTENIPPDARPCGRAHG